MLLCGSAPEKGERMVRPVVRDMLFLGQRSVNATKADLSVGQDLLDTLRANRESCVGMAANMIGIRKRIIVVSIGQIDVVMFNPVILSKQTPYPAEEGCLSLDGTRRTIRFREIEIEYRDSRWIQQKKRFSGWTAQIIQHEIDHCDGVVI